MSPTQWFWLGLYLAMVIGVALVVMRWRERHREDAEDQLDQWARPRGWQAVDETELAEVLSLRPFGRRRGSTRLTAVGRHRGLELLVGDYVYLVQSGGSWAEQSRPFAATRVRDLKQTSHKLADQTTLIAQSGWLVLVATRAMTDESDPIRRWLASVLNSLGLNQRLDHPHFFDRGEVLDQLTDRLADIIAQQQRLVPGWGRLPEVAPR